ncbi:MAG: 16S rRNA processing protein RimM [Chloroflexi bacterium]|nr:16S rRNA processing protein RimM [Chloroflexota bacterium]
MPRHPKDDRPQEGASASEALSETIVVGRVAAPWGTGGAIKAEIATAHLERFEPGRLLHVGGFSFAIESSRVRGKHVYLKLQSVDTPERAAELRGLDLEVPASQTIPAPEDTYYHFQIIGMRVRTTRGDLLGVIESILQTGSNDVYVVRTDYGEELIPAIDDVIVSIDTQQGDMVIEPVEGLLSGPRGGKAQREEDR